ncbi:MAG: hypothetical protein LC800_15875, partial [Acidobacteria bacterium]|nr:hypothetical protein [Acidobacteriota bacterium]
SGGCALDAPRCGGCAYCPAAGEGETVKRVRAKSKTCAARLCARLSPRKPFDLRLGNNFIPALPLFPF